MLSHLSHQVHPISSVAVQALTTIYDASSTQMLVVLYLTFLVSARQKAGSSRREYQGIIFLHAGYARVLIRNKGSGEDQNTAVRDRRCNDTHL